MHVFFVCFFCLKKSSIHSLIVFIILNSNGHKVVMSSLRPGATEYEMESLFLAALGYCG